jgi:hypothetical protein
MSATEPKTNRKRVQDALVNLLKADEHDNSYRYFQAADLQQIDPDLSPAIVGSYLPKIEADSPLSNGLIIERYMDRRCGASLWLVRME